MGDRDTWPRVGDRVKCILAQSRAARSVGLLRVGGVYTVTAVENTDWLKTVRLAEVPTVGVVGFSVNRFAPESER